MEEVPHCCEGEDDGWTWVEQACSNVEEVVDLSVEGWASRWKLEEQACCWRQVEKVCSSEGELVSHLNEDDRCSQGHCFAMAGYSWDH